MRHTLLLLCTALVLVAALAGCTKKSDDLASMTSSDSLVASNPSEQTPGNLTPAETPQPPPEAPPEAPPRATRPSTRPPATPRPRPSVESAPREAPGVTVESGTSFTVTFTADVTSETAKPGDAWTGTLKDNVIVGDRVVFPAGSVVHGTVRDAKPAVKGDRAMLDLAVTGIEAHGTMHAVEGGTEPIIAGSPRARNLGAMAGGAAAGALIGKAVGGSGKGALIGGLIGGAAAGAGVASSKGYQVEMKAGKELPFTVKESVTIKM
jgi:hypothetical protein